MMIGNFISRYLILHKTLLFAGFVKLQGFKKDPRDSREVKDFEKDPREEASNPK